MSLLSIQGLRKSFGTKLVLDGLDLEVETGDSFVVIGRSGSGKSVLVKIIMGLIEQDGGQVLFNGREVSGERGKFGLMFQDCALFDSLPIWHNVSFREFTNNLISAAQARDRAAKLLQEVGLEQAVLDLYPADLSGGMRKRVAFARTVFCRPELIFFDEPTAGLDPIMCSVVNDLMTKARTIFKATTVTITHDMHSVRRIATKIAMLHQGKICWQGDVDGLSSTEDKIVRQFVSGSLDGPISAV